MLDGARSISTAGMPIEHQAGGIVGQHLPDLQFCLQQADFALQSVDVFRQGGLPPPSAPLMGEDRVAISVQGLLPVAA